MRIGTVIIYFLVSEVKRKSPCLEDFYVVEAEAHEKDNIIIDLVVGKVKKKRIMSTSNGFLRALRNRIL